jgi:hypothetical protein
LEKEPFASLFHVNRIRFNRSHMTRAVIFPMEDLAGVKSPRQIEVRRGQVKQSHDGKRPTFGLSPQKPLSAASFFCHVTAWNPVPA